MRLCTATCLFIALACTAVDVGARTRERLPIRIGPDTQPVVVVPVDAPPITRYAAQELVHHIALATDIELRTVDAAAELPVGQPRIVLGEGLAVEAGFDLDALPPEVCLLRSIGRDLYIAARTGPGDPLAESNVYGAVLWGVYEVLERDLGVRWLWPGDLGTHVPRAESVALSVYDDAIQPRFAKRRLRPSLGPRGFAVADNRLAFSPAERARYSQAQAVWLRRHRMGRRAGTYFSEPQYGSGHAFHGWWERYGAEHPEWFNLRPDGGRGPADPERPHRFSMCVTNEALQQQVVALWAEAHAVNPGQPLSLGIGENDYQAACVCEPCRAWDGPDPEPARLPPGLERSYEPVEAGTRYARFAQRIHSLARAIDPDVRVHFYAYSNYFWAPRPTVERDPNVMVGFVPWFRWAGWFPRRDDTHAWIKQQWQGWQATGASVYYRPNWFLDGYTMPHVYMQQFADAFRFYAQHGMYATDFDSLQGMWAAQGPNLYLLARLHVRPDATPGELLDEYYAAFGPAADAVRAYFAYWEQYSIDNRERAADAIRTRHDGHFRRYAHYARVADELYPPRVFERGFALLASAAAQAGHDTLYGARVDWLQTGLEHARQCVAAAQVMNDPAATPADRAGALAALAHYRRSVEASGIANMDRAGIIETDSWEDVPGLVGAWPRTDNHFRDAALEHGFRLSATRSSAQPNEIGVVLAGDGEAEPHWRLAQWGTRDSLEGVPPRRDGDAWVLGNAAQTLKVFRDGLAGEGVWLEVDGIAQFDGALRAEGVAWPHLLVEQSFGEGLPIGEALRLQLQFRIDHCRADPRLSPDPGLHTAQISAYFTVHNVTPAHPAQGDMIWFGIPLFDARDEVPRGHQALDRGQPDASGKFICTLPGERFWHAPTGKGDWHTLDTALAPLLREALAASQAHGHLADSTLDDLALTSFNLGWEVPGPYACAVHVRGLRLGPGPGSD